MNKGDYLRRAAECEEIAEQLISEEARGKILKLAERWRALAENSEASSPAPERLERDPITNP